jgi:hypothetical protein
MKFSDFFKEPDGKPSITSLGFAAWVLGGFLVWATLCVMTATFIPIHSEFVYLAAVAFTGKVSHRFIAGRKENANKEQIKQEQK